MLRSENRGKWKGRQLPGIEPRTPGLCSQCSATELRQWDNQQPSQSSTCTAQVVLLPGVQLRHFITTCAVHIEDCEGWCCPIVVAQWQRTGCTSQVSWVWFQLGEGVSNTRLQSQYSQRSWKGHFQWALNSVYAHVNCTPRYLQNLDINTVYLQEVTVCLLYPLNHHSFMWQGPPLLND